MPSQQDWSQRVGALSSEQRATLAQQLGQLQGWPSEQSFPVPQRLIAYVVPQADAPYLNTAALRDTLKAKLPHYMVPAAIVPLEALPRTANGKIDTQALPEPQPVAERAAAPSTPTEATLTQIWREVLGLNTLGIHDNFFELGGDSILSIQIVSRAREAGLRLAPNQLFEQPTIAELATVVNLAPEVSPTQTAVTGVVPLTPIQHWFFEQAMAAPHHWHQAMLIELPAEVSGARVEGAIATLWTHHDALRLRFSHDSTGWQQVNVEASHPPPLAQIDLSHLSDPEQLKAIAKHGSTLHRSLNLAEGGLMRVAHFTRGENRPSWLLISLHHLIVDAVSWQILQSDLVRLLAQRDQITQLPAKTTAFKTWAETLTAQAAERQSEASFWFAQVEPPAIRLPLESPGTPCLTETTAHTVTVALDIADTQALLQSVPAVYNTQINDVLLTALAQTLLQWVDAASGSILIDVEAHGREPIVPEIDLSRTVGWFTTTYPVRLHLSDPADMAWALKSTKEQLRQIPDRGIGYGMLRYLGDKSIRRRLAQAQPSEVLFNYLGQKDLGQKNLNQKDLNQRNPTANRIRVVEDIDVGALRDPHNQRSYLLEINAWVAKTQLQINWTYDSQVYDSETATALANRYLTALKTLITHCTTPHRGGYTPSDFPDVDLSQTELDDFIAQLTQEA